MRGFLDLRFEWLLSRLILFARHLRAQNLHLPRGRERGQRVLQALSGERLSPIKREVTWSICPPQCRRQRRSTEGGGPAYWNPGLRAQLEAMLPRPLLRSYELLLLDHGDLELNIPIVGHLPAVGGVGRGVRCLLDGLSRQSQASTSLQPIPTTPQLTQRYLAQVPPSPALMAAAKTCPSIPVSAGSRGL